MTLFFSFLLTICIELITVLLFHKRKARPYATLIAFIINVFTWPVLYTLVYNTNIDMNYLMIGITIIEAIGYWLFLRCSIGRGFLISFVANSLSYIAILLLIGGVNHYNVVSY